MNKYKKWKIWKKDKKYLCNYNIFILLTRSPFFSILLQ